MSDGLPTDAQLRRIEHGVRERIETRRRVGRGVVGATAGVLVLAGGIALLPRTIASSTSAGGTAAGSAASSAGVEVRCHVGASSAPAVEAPDDPESIAAACGAVDFQVGEGRMPTSAAPGSPVASAPSSIVLCRAGDGVVHVFSAVDRPATRCAREDMQRY